LILDVTSLEGDVKRKRQVGIMQKARDIKKPEVELRAFEF